MLKSELMSFKNDIYSLGVVALVLLYKNTKLILTLIKKSFKNIDTLNLKRGFIFGLTNKKDQKDYFYLVSLNLEKFQKNASYSKPL